jgi:hypothetical protein
VLNPKGISIWRNGCPWKRAGVWDVDEQGQPVLCNPTYFREAGGKAVTVWGDFIVPFIKRMRTAPVASTRCFVYRGSRRRDDDWMTRTR